MSAKAPHTVEFTVGVVLVTVENTSSVTGNSISNMYVVIALIIPCKILMKKNNSLFVCMSFKIENI